MAELADDRVSFASAAPVVIGGPLDVPLFSKLADPAGLVRSWEKLEQRAFDRLIELLQRVIERRNGEYPECHVDLGIAYAVTGQHEKSVAALETALRQKDQDPDACYWLGRTLFESRGDLFSAVSRLREATELAPDNARAMYYLGQAIRLLVDQEMLSEAARALGGYLDAGAPLGDHDAVQAFVIERTTPATS
jgi:tetratricopeptide (TPR) repeat protein